ncbi:unnamed protein product [Didymodactylos carnosus]|uniref:Uncharacterized protein n=1 Tax=Didymodactylos carnosus TaxID=1234261 RepID=A0A8S2F1G9_9BILA|nr:unnamed protein product [Didymodactylos carnosus]CAF4102633.1 unnamed protein product [Didymodactylos carnosus]
MPLLYHLFCLLLISRITTTVSDTCRQASPVSGHGAMYRVDSSCSYSFSGSYMYYCFPNVTFNQVIVDQGYISLGIYNRFNGVSLDIGLFYENDIKRWLGFVHDARGWQFGNMMIDPTTYPCIYLVVYIADDKIIQRLQAGTMEQQAQYELSSFDPNLNLTQLDQLGFYRFDSILQERFENLKSGSKMLNVEMKDWVLYLNNTDWVAAEPPYIASNISGPCCTQDEINTVNVYNQPQQWSQSNISISYI